MKNVSVVEVLNDDLFGKHSFQVITTCEDKKGGSLYLTAPSDKERDAWMLEIRLLCYVKDNIMQSHYHPDLLHGSDWHCCKNSAKIVGCQLSYDYPSLSYKKDLAETKVEPLKTSTTTSPVSPLPPVSFESTLQAGPREERAVSMSDLEEKLSESSTTPAPTDRLRSETIASPSFEKNPFQKSLMRRQNEQQTARPPKPKRDNLDKKKETPFDRLMSNSSVQVAGDKSPVLGRVTNGETSEGAGTTSAPQPESAAAALLIDLSASDKSEDAFFAPKPGAESDGGFSWKAEFPELAEQTGQEVATVVSTADADEIDGPSRTGAAANLLDIDPVVTLTPATPEATPTAVTILGDMAAKVNDNSSTSNATNQVVITHELVEVAETVTTGGDMPDDAAKESTPGAAKAEASPFGDSGDFSSLKLPEAQNLMVKSPSLSSLASVSSESDMIKIPGPPKSLENRQSRNLSSTNLPSPTSMTSDGNILSPTYSNGALSNGSVSPLHSAVSDSSMSVSSPDALSTHSAIADSQTGARPVPQHPPSLSVSESSSSITSPQIASPDCEDEGTQSALLSSGQSSLSATSERNRSGSSLTKMMPAIFRPGGKRLSTISVSSVDGTEKFDLVHPDDCSPQSEEACREKSDSIAEPVNPFKALHQACQQGLVEEVVEQLEAGVNPDEPHLESRQPPVFMAYYHDHTEVLDVLLGHGAQVNMTMGGASGGATLLHVAARANNLIAMNILIKYKAQINLRDWQMRTPLHLACESGQLDAAKLLIDSGADLKMIDQDDCTALHMCCCRGHRPVAELLLKHQAPAFTKNKSDLTPLDLAVKEGHRSVTALLQRLLPDTEQAYIRRQSFRAHRKDVNTVLNLPEQRILTGASDNQVCIWDCASTEEVVFKRKFTNTILSSAHFLSDDKSLLAIGSDMVQVVDLYRAGWRAMLLDEPKPAYQDEQLYLVAFSPTGLLATAGVVSGTEVLLWDIFAEQPGLVRKPQLTINVGQGQSGPAVIHNMQFSCNTERPVLAVSMQPGKDRLAPKGNNIVYLLDWTLGCPLRQLDTGHEEAACDLSMAFSTQGRYLITGSSSGKVSVWTTASGLLINEIRLQEDVPVRSVTFSGNGHTLAIGSESGRVELYNIVTGKPFFLPEQYEQHPIMALAFSKSGDSLTAGYTDGTVQVWNVVGGSSQESMDEVEAYSPFDHAQAIQASGEMSSASREFLHAEFERFDADKSGSLDEKQLTDYFHIYMNTRVTSDMYMDLQQNFLTDADLGGLTIEGFTNMAFQHFCLDPESMWPIWLNRGFPSDL
ncbi:uncharacterized protein LOC135814145 [Sycon ciliatum]|uniref:uncharacterized protein LOC135814145 n=1 Tax=Sycon ciliatum TaxID=27933 RepID=UPI0031F66026